jgi:hypothetical protein
MKSQMNYFNFIIIILLAFTFDGVKSQYWSYLGLNLQSEGTVSFTHQKKKKKTNQNKQKTNQNKQKSKFSQFQS